MSAVLNAHLGRAHRNLRPCEHWTASELRELQGRLFTEADGELLAVYAAAGDNRRQRFASNEALRAHWTAVDAAASTSEDLGLVRRDGLCHEAVMMWVHHLPHSVQKRLSAEGLAPPSLPKRRHALASPNASDAERAVHAEYTQQVSCQQCHTGKIDDGMSSATLPAPLPVDKAHPGWERKRSCDFQNKPACGPCDGLGGVRTGDGVDQMTPMPCEVIHGPEVAATTRGRYPAMGVANLTMNFRAPPAVVPDGPADYQDLDGLVILGWTDSVMRMRYDFNGTGSQISAQSFEQAKQNDAGATIFTGKSCTCDRSVAGNMHIRSFEPEDPLDPLKLLPNEGGAQYLGRVKVKLEGRTSHPNGTAVADHYLKWAFHFLVDADKASPSFGLPLRLYAPYGVLQVFDGWVLGDPSVARPDVWQIPKGCNVVAPECSLFEKADDTPLVV